jgi:hypothetical protein
MPADNLIQIQHFLLSVDTKRGSSRRSTLRRTLMMALLIALTTRVASGEENPKDLVTQMVHNELHSTEAVHYWMYLDSNVKGGKTIVNRIVQTRECWFTWPVSVDGEPPSNQDRSKAEQQIKMLVDSSSVRRKNRRNIDEDSAKAKSLLKILPEAFLYKAASQNNGETVLSFRPNPKYRPPSREAKVFHAMAGELVINSKETRLEKLTGRLTHDVNFGWGILGKIRKGGTFAVTQSEEAPGDWELTKLDVHINGRALFFHTISEQQQESMTDFKPVPSGISLKQAVEMVKNGEPQK